MELDRRSVLLGVAAASGLGMAAGPAVAATGLSFDETAWRYDTAHDVYWQLGVRFAAAPDVQTLAVFVPGAYLDATANGDGTYTATVDATRAVGGFTARTAPLVLPVNTPGYSAQPPMAAYDWATVGWYTSVGFVYVHAGLRGPTAPWGVTDLKAAVRYVRFNDSALPGDKKRVFVFGMSGGGAQSAVAGASGDSRLYRPYLESIGAAMTDRRGRAISDAVTGVMAWCPITGLDEANASYEWNLGQFAATGARAAGTWTAAYSADLATAWAGYVNRLGLRDGHGRKLGLRRSTSGSYLKGSYYDHVVSVVQRSLNHFLTDTAFPWTAYASAADYVAHLNAGGAWVRYDAATNTATVLNLEGFVRSQKPATKAVGAFDGVARAATENVVFGRGSAGLHFAPVSKRVIAAHQDTYATLTGWAPEYASPAYASDFRVKDSVGGNVLRRGDMYNPMYYLSHAYDGYGTSKVAPHWRIRTGIMQGDTANTTEINLALALAGRGVEDVDFATVWNQAHVPAERTGNPTFNFIDWVRRTLAR